jgi:hypothetical protein
LKQEDEMQFVEELVELRQELRYLILNNNINHIDDQKTNTFIDDDDDDLNDHMMILYWG